MELAAVRAWARENGHEVAKQTWLVFTTLGVLETAPELSDPAVVATAALAEQANRCALSPEARCRAPNLGRLPRRHSEDGGQMAGIGLTAAIEELRQELYRAQALGADQQFTFGIEEAELELQLELRESGKGDGKLSFGVAAVGAGAELSTVRTHRLTLKLSVRDRARSGSSPEISDTENGSWDED
ncbi:hypothetical protein LT966_28665 [Streptomyces griseobrunneus]